MRKLTESTLVSLDGVIEAPEGWASFDNEATASSLAELGRYDAFGMGRVTYEKFFVNWGYVGGNPYIDLISVMPKYVPSESQTQMAWNATASPHIRRAKIMIRTRLRIDDWAESVIEEFAGGSKVTRAQVRLRDGADGLESGSASMLAYYRPDGTSEYVMLLYLSARLDGRTGTFALRGSGGFDGTTASGKMSIVPDSGTGGLAGISGTGTNESTHADYPFMPLTLSYQLP